MGKLIRLPLPAPRARSLDFGVEVAARPQPAAPELDGELLPVAGLLFVASLARVVHTLWCHEPFATEPTLALLFVLGLPWLACRRPARP